MLAGRGRRVWRIAVAAALAAVLLSSARPAPAWQQGLDPDYWQPSNLPQMGIATYYAPGMMDYVVNYRLQHGQLARCADCVGAVALLRAGDIGRKVWLQLPGSNEVAGPFLVVDCARREDIPILLDRNWAVDVSYELGQTWSMTGPLAGVIVWPDPAEGNNPPRAAVPTQYYIDPSAVVISVPTRAVAPEVRSGALPTRLPGPRLPGGPSAGATGAAVSTAPLVPLITTPTPPGAPTALVAAETPVANAEGGAAEIQVSLGRPGQELLLLAARPASFLQTPTPSRGHVAPSATISATPPAKDTPSAAPILTATPVSPPTAVPERNPGLLQRLWRAFVGWLAPVSAP